MRPPFYAVFGLIAGAWFAYSQSPADAGISLTSSLNPSVYGAPVTLTVTVTGAPGFPKPAGAITLIDGTSSQTPLATLPLDSSGVVHLSFPLLTPVGGTSSIPGTAILIPYVLSAGEHPINAVYTGDANYSYTFTKVLVQEIQQAGSATTVTTFQNPGSVTLTASVSAVGTPLPCPSFTGVQNQDGSPTGTLEFFNGGVSLGSVALQQGTIPGCISVAGITVPQVNGTLTATYSGDANFSASTYTNNPGPSSPLLPTSLKLSADPNTPTVIQPVTFTAIVDPGTGVTAPTGVVQFFLDGVKLLGTGKVVTGVDSRASVTATLTSASHNVTANYSGDGNYLPSTYSMGIYVTKLSDTVTLTPSLPSASYGLPITLTAQVKAQPLTGVANPSGTVQFGAGCACGLFNGFVVQSILGTATLSNGVATLSVPALPAGTPLLVASYSGDDTWLAASSTPLALPVAKAPTTTAWNVLATDPKSGELMATAQVRTSASGVPTGTIQVLDAANHVLASAPLSAGGTATVTISGKISSIVAVYSGDGNFSGSTSPAANVLSIADAAGYGTASVAPDQIVSIFGSGLTGSASPPVIQIADSTGASLTPVVLLASASQLNVVIPAATALGLATVTVKPISGTTFSRPIAITRVAPGLFAANGGGTGPAAAQLIRVRPDGSQSSEQVVALDATGKQWVAAPIAFGSDALYLVLYGTGIRNRSDNANVFCIIGGQKLPVLYSAAQGDFAGLDQVNVALPSTLRGAGPVTVTLTVDGQPSNTVTLAFQ